MKDLEKISKIQTNVYDSLEKLMVKATNAVNESNFGNFRTSRAFSKLHEPVLAKFSLPSLISTTRTNEVVVVSKNIQYVNNKFRVKKKCVKIDQKAPTQKQSKTKDLKVIPAPYFHLNMSYVSLEPNIVNADPIDSDFFIETIHKGLEFLKQENENDKESVFEIFKKLQQNYCENFDLRRWYEECLESQNDDEIRSKSTELLDFDLNNNVNILRDFCSDDCFKARGNISNFPLWTAREKFQIQNAMLMLQNDYCLVAKTIESKTCNEVFQLAKFLRHYPRDKGKRIDRPTAGQMKAFYEKRNGKISSHIDLSYYHPCDHEGDCKESCPCYNGKNYCEKFCKCDRSCTNQFFGCVCDARCDTKLCPCVVAHRECDSHICKKHLETQNQCCNMNFSDHPKQLEVKMSTNKAMGFGLFTKQTIEKGEFIIEYTGELVTQKDEEYRSKYYFEVKRTYLFGLCKEYSLDSFYIGNESRFINHSETPNCEVKILTASGEKKILFFAKRKILSGEEIIFSYNFPKEYERMYF